MLGKLQEETNQITEGISPETLRYLTRLEQDLYNPHSAPSTIREGNY